jgi:arabinofuranosyltransferase
MILPDADRPKNAAVAVSWVVIAGGLAAMLVVLIRTAWMSDDAYITMRTVDNFVNGFGLRWNAAERVQAFTHPAWLVLITPFYAVTREAFFTVLGLQIGLSLLAVALLLGRLARSPADAVLAIAALISSKAFVDFSSSGLENPLAHVLLLIFLMRWLQKRETTGGVFDLGLLTTALLLCRLDFAILLAPLLLSVLWPLRRERTASFLWGLLPIAAWELFSLIYYGLLVPNTALAKLAPGVSMGQLASRGLKYFSATFHFDPVTPILLGAGGVALVLAGGRAGRILAVGVLLHLGYVVSVGGDFMTGRFLTPAFVVAVSGVLATVSWSRLGGWRRVLAAAIVAGGVLNPAGPLRTGPDFGVAEAGPEGFVNGVTDERRVYYPNLGLYRAWLGAGSPERHSYAVFGTTLAREAKAGENVRVASSIGLAGYYAGPGVHLVDRNALADPLLARLPPEPDWRIGHFVRAIPAGYVESCRRRQNVIEDPSIHALFDDVILLTRASLMEPGRFAAIWRRIFVSN